MQTSKDYDFNMLRKRRYSNEPCNKEPDHKRRRMATFNNNRVLATNRYNTNKTAQQQQVTSSLSLAPPTEDFSVPRLQNFFSKYRIDDDVIGPSGMEEFSKDLGVRSDDVVLLVIAYHLNASKNGYFSRNEFVGGFTKMNVDSLNVLKGKLDQLREEVNTRLDDIYEFAFRFAKSSSAQKVIKIELAISLMKMLIPNQVHTYNFLEFLRHSKYHVINADQWKMFLLFNRSVGQNFEGYSVDGAWPVMIDEFVEYVRAKMKKAEDRMEEVEEVEVQ